MEDEESEGAAVKSFGSITNDTTKEESESVKYHGKKRQKKIAWSVNK